MCRLLICALLTAVSVSAREIPEKISFNEHIRPILSDKCFHCHGPHVKHIKGKLQLHTSENAVKNLSKKGKRFAVVPGSPEKSTLIDRINTLIQAIA